MVNKKYRKRVERDNKRWICGARGSFMLDACRSRGAAAAAGRPATTCPLFHIITLTIFFNLLYVMYTDEGKESRDRS